jgi:CHU_C Type IX secretion signal domain/FG-GAP-like repeat/Bacterial Ig-like domain
MGIFFYAAIIWLGACLFPRLHWSPLALTRLPSGTSKQSKRLLAGFLLLVISPARAQTHLIVGTSPALNAPHVGPTAPLVVTFSQAVPAASAASIKVFTSQRRGYRAGTYTGANTSAIGFQPAQPFAPGELISLTVPATAASTANQPNTTPGVYQFTQAVPAGNGTFQSLPFLPSGGTSTIRPHNERMATGDLDNDGDLDLLMPSYEAHLVYVSFNNGLGGFSAPAPIAPLVYSGPVSVDLGDMDGDGDLDALVVSQLLDAVTVYRNNGSGGFASGVNVSVGPTPENLCIGDLDADGDLDFVVGNTFATSISVRLNNGNGLFAAAADVSVRANPRGIALGDVDRDGDLDMVVAHSVTVSTWLNNGSGQFTTPYFLGVAMGDPAEVVLADLNRDGHLDVVTDDYYGSVLIRLGSASGTLGPMINISAGYYFGGLAVADFNADGAPDLARSTTDMLYVMINQGGGSFAAPLTLPLSGTKATSVVTGDVDNDGDIDLLVNNYLQRRVDEFLNQGAPPVVRITGDSLLCGSGTLTLSTITSAPPLAYRWSTGATTPTITVSQPGAYSVTVTFSGSRTSTAQFRVMALAPLVRIAGDSILCPNATLNLAGSAPNATAYLWSTGATTATIAVTQPGTYTFTARYGSGCSASRQLVVRAPELRVTGPTQLCPGGSNTLTAVAPGAVTYRWSTGASSATLTVTQPGTFTVLATYPAGCTLLGQVTVVQSVAVIGGDSLLCSGRPTQLTAAQPTATAYLWNTGSTASAISVAQAGTYSVVVTYPNGCQSSARVRVRPVQFLAPVAIGPDSTLCEGTTARLRPNVLNPDAAYRWNTGATTPTLVAREAGVYTLQVTTPCDTYTASRRLWFRPCLTVPNLITPNGDRLNEQFKILGLTGDWSLQLYNRWGQQVYTTPAYQNDWGADAAAGVYYYLLQQAGTAITYKGWLEVIR